MSKKAVCLHNYFYNLSIQKTLILLLSLVITAVAVIASTFVYYPMNITNIWVNPPVMFQDPSVPGVKVNLYDDDTKAIVDLSTTKDLILKIRHAFIYDDFSTNPFEGANPRLAVLGGNYGPNGQVDYVPGVGLLSGEVRFLRPSDGSYNLEHVVVYFSGSRVPNDARKIYILVKSELVSQPRGLWKGIFFFNSIDDKLYYTYELWDTIAYSPGMRIALIHPNSNLTLISGGQNDKGELYIQWGIRDRLNGYMEHRIYKTDGTPLASISITDTGLANTPIYLGFGGVLMGDGQRERFDFDDFVACVDADPRYVNVTGLQQGWIARVEYKQGNQYIGLTPWASAGYNGLVNLNIMAWPIVRDGYLHICYPNGSTILRKYLSVIVGGDVYSLVSFYIDLRTLDFKNFDSKPYNVSLRLESLSVSGLVNSLDIVIYSVSSTSTPINILNNVIVADETSTTTLAAGGTGSIYSSAMLSSSTAVVMDLTFKYYLLGVEVYYPIKVAFHG